MRWILLTMLALMFPVAGSSAGLIDRMPDEYALVEGYDDYQNGFHKGAHDAFLRSAKWGNRWAQNNIAVMYWTGVGAEKNLPTAWAWADLASGQNHSQMVRMRGNIAAEMTTDQMIRAQEIRAELEGDYGDDVAEKKRHRWAWSEKRKKTGSHTGLSTSNVRLISSMDQPWVSDSRGNMMSTADSYYQGRLKRWTKELKEPVGRVEFGEFNVLEEQHG